MGWLCLRGGWSVLENGRVANWRKRGPGFAGQWGPLHRAGVTRAVWVGTEGGLCRFTNGGFAVFTKTNGLSSNFIYSLYEAKAQQLSGSARPWGFAA